MNKHAIVLPPCFHSYENPLLSVPILPPISLYPPNPLLLRAQLASACVMMAAA